MLLTTRQHTSFKTHHLSTQVIQESHMNSCSPLLLPIFGFPQNKKNENEKIQKNISKNIRKKSKNNRSEKDVGMLKKE